MTTTSFVSTIALFIILSGCSPSQEASSSDGAALHDFVNQLNNNPSATAVLQERCSLKIQVRHLPINARPSQTVLQQLDITSEKYVKVRHVELICGNIPLSEAWNWYVPQRLTAGMNNLLETTNIPFGKIVKDTHFYRQKLISKLIPNSKNIILDNQAVLKRKQDAAPIAFVIERYFNAVLKKQN